ncbi:MAG: N-acetyltransferase family protein [Thermoleophilaceae bacterium]
MRPASPRDLEALARIQHAAWERGFVPLLPREFEVPPAERFQELLARTDTRRVVAVDGESPVGWVSLGAGRDSDSAAGTGELRALFVHPEHWGRGAGGALVHHVLDALSRMGYGEVTVWSFAANERANRLYEGTGFERDGAERREPLFAGALEVRYRRPLPG